MPRIRSIKPSLPSSFSLSQVSIPARYLFTAMFTLADDDGRLMDSPKQIVGDLFPHDRGVTAARVSRWLDELEQVNCIRRYTAGGGRYLYFPEWRKHQRISHPTPSIFPSPPGISPEAIANGSGKPPDPFRPDMEGEREREWEGEWRDTQVPTHLQQREPPAGQKPRDGNISKRLGAACVGRNRPLVTAEAEAVVAWARRFVDDQLIDEAVGFCAQAEDRPKLPRAVATLIRRKAADHQIDMPEFMTREGNDG